MGSRTKISWTDSTWNPWVGCRKVSEGCRNCYAFRMRQRFGQDPTDIHPTAPRTIHAPERWETPRRIFACSLSDFFLEDADPWRGEAWRVIRRTPQHTYQLLTKRPQNILERLPEDWGSGWQNVWLGVTLESEDVARRVPQLLEVPAIVRFLSIEPLLSPIRWEFTTSSSVGQPSMNISLSTLDWIIVGGESGPGARQMNLDWARALRDNCRRIGVPFFFKQVGGNHFIDDTWGGDLLDGERIQEFPTPGCRRDIRRCEQWR